jgi:energy-coupling factor transport system permease protein
VQIKFIEPELKDTFFHRLDVRTKLIMLFCVALLGIVLSQWQSLACSYLMVLMMVSLARVSRDKLKVLAIITFLTVWGIMWVQAVFYDAHPRTPLIYLLPPRIINPSAPVIGSLWEGIAIYYEGFTYGISQSLRIMAPMTLGLLIFWTEDPARMLTGLNRLKLPYVISFMVMTCLRFVPITIGEAKVTLDSQRLRKYRPFDFKGMILGYGIYKATAMVIVPLLANCVRRALNMARSADARAFRAYERRSEVCEMKIKTADRLWGTLFLLTVALLLAGKFLFYLYVTDHYVNETLRPLYWFAHRYL